MKSMLCLLYSVTSDSYRTQQKTSSQRLAKLKGSERFHYKASAFLFLIQILKFNEQKKTKQTQSVKHKVEGAMLSAWKDWNSFLPGLLCITCAIYSEAHCPKNTEVHFSLSFNFRG